MAVEKIAVVGAGVMGRGIAHAGALGGFEVRLHDLEEGVLEKATSAIEKEMKKAVEKGKLEEGKMREALERISTTSDLGEAVSGADLVVEAVLEKMNLKLDLFRQFDELCGPETVLGTNTSTMSPTQIAVATGRPGKCMAMHFFNPAHRMKLVELVRASRRPTRRWRSPGVSPRGWARRPSRSTSSPASLRAASTAWWATRR